MAAEPQKILTLDTDWDSSKGGVSTVNRFLSIGLAEQGYDVTARVSNGGEAHPGVDVSIAPAVPGMEDRANLLNPVGLPEKADVIIGHSRFSGGPAAVLKQSRYPDAHLIHFVHTASEMLGRLQGDNAKANRNAEIERQLLAGADLVVAVGPLLAEETRRMARQVREIPPPVHEFIPGIAAHPQPAYPVEAVHQPHILLFGRADEPLKGAANAADIVRVLGERGMDVQLTVRGATVVDAGKQEQILSARAGRQVWVKPFTANQAELLQDLRGTDLVLIPSLHEGFGLVATEAAGTGVPILVGSHTGVGMFLSDPRRVPPEFGMNSVVPDLSSNIALWADRTEAALENLGAQRSFSETRHG